MDKLYYKFEVNDIPNHVSFNLNKDERQIQQQKQEQRKKYSLQQPKLLYKRCPPCRSIFIKIETCSLCDLVYELPECYMWTIVPQESLALFQVQQCRYSRGECKGKITSFRIFKHCSSFHVLWIERRQR